MKPSTQDQVEGTLHEAHNPDLARQDRTEALAGKAQNKIGQIKKVFGK